MNCWYTRCTTGLQKAGALGQQDSLLKPSKGKVPSHALGKEETPGTHLYRLDGVWLENCIPLKALGILVNT